MNQYEFSVLPNSRWGIFFEGRLLASVGSQGDAKRIVRYLQGRSNIQSAVQPAPVHDSAKAGPCEKGQSGRAKSACVKLGDDLPPNHLATPDLATV